MSHQDGGRIYFGSLEHSERNRLLEESKSDAMSIASHSTKVKDLYKMIDKNKASGTTERKLRPTGRVATLELSQVKFPFFKP